VLLQQQGAAVAAVLQTFPHWRLNHDFALLLLLLPLLLQAEVQGKNTDGGIQLHTRSIKFGKVGPAGRAHQAEGVTKDVATFLCKDVLCTIMQLHAAKVKALISAYMCCCLHLSGGQLVVVQPKLVS
jgi:hypothetical protein